MISNQMDLLRERSPEGLEIARTIIQQCETAVTEPRARKLGRRLVAFPDQVGAGVTPWNEQISTGATRPHRTVALTLQGHAFMGRQSPAIYYDMIDNPAQTNPDEPITVFFSGEATPSTPNARECASLEVANTSTDPALLFDLDRFPTLPPEEITEQLWIFELVVRLALEKRV